MIQADYYKVKQVKNPHDIIASVPGSKSITNRALLIAAMGQGRSTLSNVLFSDDSRHFLQALIDLGFAVEIDEEHCVVSIEGMGGKVPCFENAQRVNHKGYEVNGVINVGSAGTAARFLTAYLGLSKGSYYVDSSEQMKKRPMKELLDALRELGAEITFVEEEDHFPFVIGNPEIAKAEVTVDVDKSSQFLSALLIVSVLLKEEMTIHVEGSHGMAYVRMTMDMMAQFGCTVEEDSPKTYRIPGASFYLPKAYAIEPDLSAACYFYAMSLLLRVKVQVLGVVADSLQGDIWFLPVLCDMGCLLQEDEKGLILLPPKGPILGGEWNLSAFSDQALTLAAIAPFANSKVVIQKVGHIRMQECDRIEAILKNLSAMGILCTEEEGTITIYPGDPKPCTIETYNDHRVAMSFTLPGLVADGIVIQDPACCRKTFEDYYEKLEEYVY